MQAKRKRGCGQTPKNNKTHLIAKAYKTKTCQYTALFIISYLAVSACTTQLPHSAGPTDAHTAQPTPIDETTVYYGTFSAPCGRSLLKIATIPDGPTTLVQASGDASPIHQLRYHTLITGRFKLWGKLTGKSIDDNHCGDYAEFVVEKFEPWGKIKRCTSVGSLDPQMNLYTDNQPTDHYTPSDFKDGSRFPALNDDTCVMGDTACAEGFLKVTGCDETAWCCQLLK